jgi:regulatory protein NPR1
MDNKFGFSESNELSNSSSICSVATNAETLSSEPSTAPDISALRRLSENLESIFVSPASDHFADAKIVLSSTTTNAREVPIHRCILAARSPFFKSLFSGSSPAAKCSEFELKELARDYEVGLDALEAVLAYLYSGKVKPLPKDVCVCVDEDCPHEACRPAVDFMVEVLYASFTFQISELIALYQVRVALAHTNSVQAFFYLT